jgi:hypothetical protein
VLSRQLNSSEELDRLDANGLWGGNLPAEVAVVAAQTAATAGAMTGAKAMPAAKPMPAPTASKAGLRLAEVGLAEVGLRLGEVRLGEVELAEVRRKHLILLWTSTNVAQLLTSIWLP